MFKDLQFLSGIIKTVNPGFLLLDEGLLIFLSGQQYSMDIAQFIKFYRRQQLLIIAIVIKKNITL